MNTAIHIFNDPLQLAESLSAAFITMAKAVMEKYNVFNIALSGGSTPGVFYNYLGTKHSGLPFWKNTHIFWGDERCVPPDDPDSNYRMAWELLIKNVRIPEKNIHRIRGEEAPNAEAERYCREISQFLPKTEDERPVFDWILLGLGEDGHTASIFPGIQLPENKSTACAVASHPTTGQKRITLTLPVINCSRKVTFLVSGQTKTALVTSIIKREESSKKLPAARVIPVEGELEWYLDADAAAGLNLISS
jgi:6-phosphogluconolactonase